MPEATRLYTPHPTLPYPSNAAAMADEEHEVYGQEIPLDGEDVDMGAPGDEAAKVSWTLHAPFPPLSPPDLPDPHKP